MFNENRPLDFSNDISLDTYIHKLFSKKTIIAKTARININHHYSELIFSIVFNEITYNIKCNFIQYSIIMIIYNSENATHEYILKVLNLKPNILEMHIAILLDMSLILKTTNIIGDVYSLNKLFFSLEHNICLISEIEKYTNTYSSVEYLNSKLYSLFFKHKNIPLTFLNIQNLLYGVNVVLLQELLNNLVILDIISKNNIDDTYIYINDECIDDELNDVPVNNYNPVDINNDENNDDIDDEFTNFNIFNKIIINNDNIDNIDYDNVDNNIDNIDIDSNNDNNDEHDIDFINININNNNDNLNIINNVIDNIIDDTNNENESESNDNLNENESESESESNDNLNEYDIDNDSSFVNVDNENYDFDTNNNDDIYNNLNIYNKKNEYLNMMENIMNSL
jgi:hypothetical protein